MMKKILTIDPGDHIGTLRVMIDNIFNTSYIGHTIQGDNRLQELWQMLNEYQPDEIVFERFALRANAAQKLVGNTFITCEVIAVIKQYVQLNNVKCIELLPSTKEYCGVSSSPKDPKYTIIKFDDSEKISEHVRDTYRLYSYYKLFGEKLNKK